MVIEITTYNQLTIRAGRFGRVSWREYKLYNHIKGQDESGLPKWQKRTYTTAKEIPPRKRLPLGPNLYWISVPWSNGQNRIMSSAKLLYAKC